MAGSYTYSSFPLPPHAGDCTVKTSDAGAVFATLAIGPAEKLMDAHLSLSCRWKAVGRVYVAPLLGATIHQRLAAAGPVCHDK